MLNRKIISKTASETNNLYSYLFEHTSEEGIRSEIEVTALNDDEAFSLAESEENNRQVRNKIRVIISNFYDGPSRLLLNPHYSNESIIVAAIPGTDNWFSIPVLVVKEINHIGFSSVSGKEYPFIEIVIKEDKIAFIEELKKRKWISVNDNFEIGYSTPLETFKAERDLSLVREVSGSQWVARYPGSKSISDLISPFRENVTSFNGAMTSAGATINISATLRPVERAYLMKTSWDIAKGNIKASNAPPLAGVDIEWVHPTEAASIQAAKDMVTGYGIVFSPAYPTNHSDGTAIDMNISWSGTLKIKKADGTEVQITSTPRDNNNTDLHDVGESYNVFKLVSDKPHWSADGR